MKKTLLFFVAICATSLLNAQDKADSTKNWKFGGFFSLTMNQVSLHNWQAGGENSVSANLITRLTADYKKDKFSWKNRFEAGYGLIQQASDPTQKTDDRLEFSTQAGHEMNDKWEFNGFATFRTQFTNGYKNPGDDTAISKFMAPAYILAGLGFEYKPSKWFIANISPVTGKMTIVNDQRLSDEGRFGVDKGKTTRTELGGYLKIVMKKEIMKNITFETKADFFSNYLEKPGNIDVTWDVLLVMKVNKWISANLTTNLIYDDDIDIVVKEKTATSPAEVGPRVQFKEVFGAGLTLKF